MQANQYGEVVSVHEKQEAEMVVIKTGGSTTTVDGLPRPKYVEERNTSVWPFLFFPYHVNELVARVVGAFITALGICGIIFRGNAIMDKIVAGIAIHFALVFVGGARASPLGLLAELFCLPFKANLIGGPPKQFAALCGLMFSGPAAILLLWSKEKDDKGAKDAASVLLGILAFCALCEAALNFCWGCLFFNIACKLGLITKQLGAKLDRASKLDQDAYDEDFRHPTLTMPQTKTYAVGPGGVLTDVDFKYKTTSDDYKDFHQHPIQHMQITYFISAVGLTGIALLWRISDESTAFQSGKALWNAMGYIAAAYFCFLLVLYAIKALVYPRKVCKEWCHPVKSNAFSAIPLTILLFAGLVYQEGRGNEHSSMNRFYRALFWLGSMTQLVLALFSVGRWFSQGPTFIENCNPTMLFPPLSLFVAAVVGASYQNELSWFFFSFALIMWLILFPVILVRCFFYTQLEDKLRPSVFIFLAASSVATVAYANLNDGVWDNFTRILFYFSWGLFLTFAAMTIQRFFGQVRFEMGAWSYLFPLAAFAIANILYRDAILGPVGTDAQHPALSEAMSVVAMVFANLAAVLLIEMMLIGIGRKTVFVADDKWGPLSFMKTCHIAMRASVATLTGHAQRLAGGSEKRQVFIDSFLLLKEMHHIHSIHEDQVLFPLFDQYFPGVTEAAVAEHHRNHDEFAALAKLVADLVEAGDAPSEVLVESIKQETANLATHMNEHFANEEENLNPIARKHLSLQFHIELLRRIFDTTDARKWEVLMPYLVDALPLYAQKLRLLRTLRWGLPERMQQIGRWLYIGLDPFLFDRLGRSIPEIVPRFSRPIPFGNKTVWRRYW